MCRRNELELQGGQPFPSGEVLWGRSNSVRPSLGAFARLFEARSDAKRLFSQVGSPIRPSRKSYPLRAAHLQTPFEQTVLVDGMATRAAFLAGLQHLAQRAAPDDVVMVFWSGHGNVQPAVQIPVSSMGSMRPCK